MNKIWIIFGLLISGVAFPQDILSVRYEAYMQTPENDRFKNNPQKQGEYERAHKEAAKTPSFYLLTTDNKEASFLLEEKINNEQKEEKSAIKISYTPSSNYYTNLEENYILSEAIISNKDYLIKEELPKIEWRITKDSKEILGIEVRKATAERDGNNTVVAWYAPQINYKAGPSDSWGLPGLILELSESYKYPNGTTTVSFHAIDLLRNNPNSEIKKLKKGEIITPEEYETRLLDFQKKFREMHGGGVDRD